MGWQGNGLQRRVLHLVRQADDTSIAAGKVEAITEGSEAVAGRLGEVNSDFDFVVVGKGDAGSGEGEQLAVDADVASSMIPLAFQSCPRMWFARFLARRDGSGKIEAMIRAASIFLMAFLPLVPTGRAAEPLTKLEGCRLVRTEWADGDSFQIRASDGKEHTLRLYGADCIEWHVTDKSDARRLREQRRYFGIADIGGSVPASNELAKGFGKSATERVAVLLKSPFTVSTAFADARGDGRHQRIYGFVNLADGRDLAAVLVEEGLARAFGVYRETPGGKTSGEYREAMRDLELLAAKRSVGIWARTNWEKLPEERRQQRQEEADLALAAGKAEIPISLVLDPNTAARDDLLKLPGIGELMANRIIEARPFRTLEDLLEVPGIGLKTLEKLRPHLTLAP